MTALLQQPSERDPLAAAARQPVPEGPCCTGARHAADLPEPLRRAARWPVRCAACEDEREAEPPAGIPDGPIFREMLKPVPGDPAARPRATATRGITPHASGLPVRDRHGTSGPRDLDALVDHFTAVLRRAALRRGAPASRPPTALQRLVDALGVRASR